MNRYSQGQGTPRGGRGKTRFRFIGAAAVLVILGCGKKGPPLPPLPHRPAPATGIRVRQVGPSVRLSFRLPGVNLDGTPAVELGVRLFRRPTRIEDAGPERRDWLERNFLRGAETIHSSRADEVPRRPGAPEIGVLEDTAWSPALSPGFLLSYRVLLVGAGGRGTPSPPVFILPRVGLRPPTGLRWGEAEVGILLEWDPGTGGERPAGEETARQYNLYRATGPGPFPDQPLNPQPLERASFEDRQRPSEGGTHRYVVREVFPDPFALLESGDSAQVRVSTPQFVRPPAPTDLTVAVTGDLIRLIWIPPPGDPPGGFRVYRRIGPDGEEELLGEIPPSEVSFTDRTARPGVDYWYRVTSFSARPPGRESEPTGPVKGALPPRNGGSGEPE